MNNSTTFYIIVPVYNSMEYLDECLDSIKKQTFEDFICIMVNDGSTDESEQICKKYETNDKRFFLISQKNQGVSAARNKGMDFVLKTAGDDSFLIFVDSDDTLNVDYIENYYDAIKKTDDSYEKYLYLCAYNQISKENIIQKKIESSEKIIKGSMRENFDVVDSYMSFIWGKAYSLKVLKKANIRFDENIALGEDTIFNFLYLAHVELYYFINKCIYNYKILDLSLSHMKRNESHFNQICCAIKARCNFLVKYNVKNKETIINKHIANFVHTNILNPYYKRLYELRKNTYSKHTQTSGQARVIFCLRHKLLWLYRLYLLIFKRVEK